MRFPFKWFPVFARMLSSRLMFEARFQTYWADVHAAGIVYYPHFFRFVEHAEEELFRAAGRERQPLIEESGIWMPRVESFSKFSKPIRHGAAIRVRLSPEIKGEKDSRCHSNDHPKCLNCCASCPRP